MAGIRKKFIFLIVCTLAAVSIVFKAQADDEAVLREVMPLGVFFEPVKSDGQTIYYRALDAQKQLIGACFKAYGKGYSSTIETMVGMLKNGQVTAIKVLSQKETPGLGGRVAEQQFTGQFVDQQDLSRVQAVTHASISSRAVINSVSEKKAQVEKLLNR